MKTSVKIIHASYNHTSNDQYTLQATSHAHVIHAFVNGVYAGSAHGRHHMKEALVLTQPILLKKGQNTISLLSVMVGSPDNGAYLERRVAGLGHVKIVNKRNQQVDLSYHQWGYQVGLIGESSKIYTQQGSEETNWGAIGGTVNRPLIWYKTIFHAPSGTDPVALNPGGMGKGEAWINGESIGRYWVSFKTPKGQPSQYLYHISPIIFEAIRKSASTI